MDKVEIVSSLDDIYTVDNLARYKVLRERFTSAFGGEPAFYARAPGRVNIIGEHIDYMGYGVFPMAIENDVIMAVATREDTTVNLRHVN